MLDTHNKSYSGRKRFCKSNNFLSSIHKTHNKMLYNGKFLKGLIFKNCLDTIHWNGHSYNDSLNQSVQHLSILISLIPYNQQILTILQSINYGHATYTGG